MLLVEYGNLGTYLPIPIPTQGKVATWKVAVAPALP